MSFIPGKLDNDEIINRLLKDEYPTSFSMTKAKAREMVDMFWRLDAYNSLISRETYLNYLINFIKDKKDVPKSRFEFLDYVFNKLFSDVFLINKLDHVGIDMEYAQLNEIDNKRFLKLLDDDEFPNSKIDYLYQNHIIENRKESEKSEIIKTGFYHHIVQEFLAAKCFLRNGVESYLDILLIKESGTLAINPSWYGVIRFLLESEECQTVLDWLLNFVDEHRDCVNEYFTNTVTSIDSKLIQNETKKRIFELIFDTYQEKVIWVPTWSRKALANFCQPEHIKLFKEQIEKGNNKTEIIVKTGNIISIISGLLRIKNKLTEEDRNFWKEKLIKIVNIDDENGVLQRNSLDALEAFKDPTIIPQVEKCYQHTDSLVKEAFIEFCYKTNPDDPLAIKYFVEGIKDDVNYYPRRGLYKIKSQAGIELVLNYLSTDIKFLNKFIDGENIYNDKGRKQDRVLIKNIAKNLGNSSLIKLKNVVKLAFDEKRYYKFEKSYVLSEIVRLIKFKEKNYIFEILDSIKNSNKDKWSEFYNYRSLFSWIIEVNDLDKLYEQFKVVFLERAEAAFESIIYLARFDRKEDGEEIYKIALEKKYIKDHSKDPIPEWEKNRKTTYQEFLDLLEPVPGKYSPLVFEYYNQHQKELEQDIKPFDLERLKKVMNVVLKAVDPTKIKVTIKDKKSESRSYNITEWTRYYVDAVRTSQLFGLKINKNLRKNLINFIPFAYSDDRSTIEDLVKKINDNDLEFVNQLYLDKKNDARYHLPDSYIEIVEHYIDTKCKLVSPLRILKSFVDDHLIKSYSRESALKLLEKFLNKNSIEYKEYIQKIFDSKIKQSSEENKRLSEVANRILITKFHDDNAINWRFKKIKEKKKEMEGFVQKMKVHTVGEVENEINDKYFAFPLIKLADINFINKLIELLDFSIKMIKVKNLKTQAFVDYIWSIYYGYLENLKPRESIKAIRLTNKWIDANAKINGINWFRYRVDEIRDRQLLKLGIDNAEKNKLEVRK